MKLPCEMMEDLLPLYAENMVTDVTRAAVEEHLSSCGPCREKLAAMQAEKRDALPKASLEPVRLELRRRRRYAAMAAACAVAVVLLILLSAISKPVFIRYTENDVKLEAVESGVPGAGRQVRLSIYGASSLDWSRHTVERADGSFATEIEVVPWTTRWDQWISLLPWGPGVEVKTLDLDADDIVWYINEAERGEMILLQGESADDGGYVLPRLIMGYYVMLAAVGAGVMGLLWLALRKHPAGRVMKQLTVLALSYVAAHFLIMGSSWLTYDAMRDLLHIVLLALSLWGLVFSGEQLIRQRRRDRL